MRSTPTSREVALTGLDHDITYIRLRVEFIYLAVILDAFSRQVIGWALNRTLEDTLTVSALRMALARRPAPGLVPSQDRPRPHQFNSIERQTVS